ncbi:DUF2970 domain-containing protein [Aliidiomarina halalkaliphila]|uniref:DUF2970 domain-containing protein n=1 Tax=Aliidiomarina halalkaliphila TaxID=2593535 RepID=A0A552X1L7_9GAMM|nr:DUF2970 domain-containing protein [Aliidiomarina halalkaliphila]TRW48493.1 DUF2970 domain-containing protein [Aliidiomarina halalkaliphila]
MTEQRERPGLFAVVISVLAAMFGVQTEANRQRDFSAGNPLAYIIVFVIILVLFVLSVAAVVKLVMNLTG